jgi:hypothetical protein
MHLNIFRVSGEIEIQQTLMSEPDGTNGKLKINKYCKSYCNK